MASLGVTSTGLAVFLCFHLPMFFGFAAFYVAFNFQIPKLVATSARCRAAKIFFVLHVLTLPGFVVALHLEHASNSPITVR